MKKTLLTVLTLLLIFTLLSSCAKTEGPYEWESQASPDFLSNTEKTEPTPALDYKKVSFIGAGDNIIYYGTVRDAQRNAVQGGRKYNFKPIFSDVEPYIQNADIAFINQETVMAGDGYALSYYPNFNSPQELAYDLYELGFDIVSIANNHMLDQGAKGLERTIDYWKTIPVTLVGGYKTQEDYNDIRVYEKNGIKIAVLSYTYGTNGYTPSSSVYIPYLFEVDIEKQVSAAKAKADFVIVSVHWGDEGSMKQNDSQKQYAQKFADAGVDAVIGHHPHVIQPVEWVQGKNGNKMLCVYSLGNFEAEQDRDYNMLGGMISFDICKYGDDKPMLENVRFIPTVFDYDGSFYNNHIYLLEKYTAEQAANHGIKAYGRKTSLDTFRRYVSNTVSAEFLPESYLESLK